MEMTGLTEIQAELEELKKTLKNIEENYFSNKIAYKIECNTGGFVLSGLNKEDPFSVSCDSLDKVFWYLIEDLEPQSRYDDKRLYVVRMPGDKNEKHNDHHSYILENCVGVTD